MSQVIQLYVSPDNGITWVPWNGKSTGTGGVTFPLLMPDGTAPAPSLAFTSDSNTGLYHAAADSLGVAVNGASFATLGPATFTVNAPMALAGGTSNLSIGGTLTVTGASQLNGGLGVSGVVRATQSTAAAPTYSFTGDTNTGFFSPAADTVAIVTGGIERIRIPPSATSLAEVLIGGLTAPLFPNAGRGDLEINGTTNAFIGFATGGVGSGYILSNTTNFIVATLGAVPLAFDTNNTERMRIDTSGHTFPGADAVQNLGIAGARWKEVFASVGAINISDARVKTDVVPLTEEEIAASKDLAAEIGTYQFLAALEEKGSAARLHVGLTVQRAMEIMESYGLDPFQYGFICYDQWEERTRVDEDGNTVILGEAGDSYGFRHDELLLFIARGFDARLTALEKEQ